MDAFADLVAGVKAYALEHYNDGGWDVIVECWSDAEIAARIIGVTNLTEAIGEFRAIVSINADREADARNSAF